METDAIIESCARNIKFQAGNLSSLAMNSVSPIRSLAREHCSQALYGRSYDEIDPEQKERVDDQVMTGDEAKKEAWAFAKEVKSKVGDGFDKKDAQEHFSTYAKSIISPSNQNQSTSEAPDFKESETVEQPDVGHITSGSAENESKGDVDPKDVEFANDGSSYSINERIRKLFKKGYSRGEIKNMMEKDISYQRVNNPIKPLLKKYTKKLFNVERYGDLNKEQKAKVVEAVRNS